MAQKVYHDLCAILAKRGGTYPGKDIPEFYALVEELFTPEEGAVYNAIPKGFHPAEAIAKEMRKEECNISIGNRKNKFAQRVTDLSDRI